MSYRQYYRKPKLRIILLITLVIFLFVQIGLYIRRSRLENNIVEKGFNKKNALCMVLTAEKTLLTRGVAVWETWGQHCEQLLFMCSCNNIENLKNIIKNNDPVPPDLEIYKKVVNYPILNLNIQENYQRMGEKVFHVLKQAYNLYKGKFDWFYMVDDDTYVFVDNLNKFTNNRNSSEALYFGFKFNIMVPEGYIGGGAGILFTDEAMKRIVKAIEKKNCDQFIDAYGDITIGQCGYSVGVRIGDSLDKYKKPRFHPHDHKTHYYGPVPHPLMLAGSHNGKIGKECCSLETISFHYVTIEDMYSIYANKTFLKDLLL